MGWPLRFLHDLNLDPRNPDCFPLALVGDAGHSSGCGPQVLNCAPVEAVPLTRLVQEAKFAIGILWNATCRFKPSWPMSTSCQPDHLQVPHRRCVRVGEVFVGSSADDSFGGAPNSPPAFQPDVLTILFRPRSNSRSS